MRVSFFHAPRRIISAALAVAVAAVAAVATAAGASTAAADAAADPNAAGAQGPTTVPVPTDPQLWYQQAEIHALIHFNMATFIKNGDPGCSPDNWNTAAPGAAGPSSDPATFNPKLLNTSQWGDVMQDLGARGAILTAKHGCGFLLWPSATKLPDGSPYQYRVGASKAAIQRDVLKEFQQSMEERQIGHGFYYSLTNNFYLNVRGHHAGYSANPLPGQVNVSQAEFEALALSQVKELWSNYGSLSEIWFDGGFLSDQQEDLRKALMSQPKAIGYQGVGISSNPSTWVGTESGHPNCPQGVWSTGSGQGCGDPDGKDFVPKTCDTTLQNSDSWFWTPPATNIRSLAEMIGVYHDTVGKNGVMELDFAIDRDGLVAKEHAALYKSLGDWIRSCYGAPFPYKQMSGGGGPQKDGSWIVGISLVGGPVAIDRVMIRERLQYGQRVRRFNVDLCPGANDCAEDEAAWHLNVVNGTSIGNKRIALLPTAYAANALRLRVYTAAPTMAPELMDFAAFSPCSDGA